jgi:DNA (cytosine-5)-methyltransferase 1
MTNPTIYWIDLFCGAGGTTTGIHLAEANAIVLACVNHDAKAIAAHEANHPNAVHFTEDIRDFAVVLKIKKLVDEIRDKDPNCKINIWASLECTNYSKAKGGQPRNADSRTLAEHLFMYIDELNPDYLYIENVREFMAWGPLDVFCKPVSKDKGKDYLKWVNNIKKRGFNFDYRLLNAADFGAYTSRERFFGQFAKKGMPINWPQATHSKKVNSTPGLFEKPRTKWKAVREVLLLDIEGESIFNRKKPLVDNTLERIYAGLVKFSSEVNFTYRNNGGSVNPEEKSKSLDRPMGTILSGNVHNIVKTIFTAAYNSGNDAQRCKSPEEPIGTLTTQNSHAVVSSIHLNTYYGKSGLHSVNSVCPTLTTKDRVAVVNSHFIDQQYSNSLPASIEVPSGALTTVPKLALVNVQKWLLNPQFSSKGSSIEQPCFTLIARMDKKPPYIVSTETGEGSIIIYEDDNPVMVKIKEFMAEHGIIDIKMRMLLVDEMLRIQGFPEGYKLQGTQTDQKKFIGNSVVPLVAQKLVEANYDGIVEWILAA